MAVLFPDTAPHSNQHASPPRRARHAATPSWAPEPRRTMGISFVALRARLLVVLDEAAERVVRIKLLALELGARRG